MGHTIRNRESEIAAAVSNYLYDAGGSATIAQIRRALPFYIELTDVDRQPSLSRPGEEIWEQLVRNIVCHRFSEGNAIQAGALAYQPRRLVLPNGPQGEMFC